MRFNKGQAQEGLGFSFHLILFVIGLIFLITILVFFGEKIMTFALNAAKPVLAKICSGLGFLTYLIGAC